MQRHPGQHERIDLMFSWPELSPLNDRGLRDNRLIDEEGPDGLAVLPFRSAKPYDGEDLVYTANNPEQFLARCTRAAGAVRGACISERALDGAQLSIRFPRDWLSDWRNLAATFDRLVTQLHPNRR